MNLKDALHVWRRRWILTLLLVLVVLALSAAAAMKLPRHYTAQSDVVLLPSASSTVPNGRNPYLTYNGSLPMTAQILSYQLMAPETVLGLTARGYTASFTATLAPNTAGAPVLNILVTGSNKNTVETTLHGVTNAIASKLAALQTGIAPNNQITALTLSVDTSPTLSVSKTARPLVVVLGLGLVLALAIPLMVDGAARRRTPDQDKAPAVRRVHELRDVAMPMKTSGGARRQTRDEADLTLGERMAPPGGSFIRRRSGK